MVVIHFSRKSLFLYFPCILNKNQGYHIYCSIIDIKFTGQLHEINYPILNMPTLIDN